MYGYGSLGQDDIAATFRAKRAARLKLQQEGPPGQVPTRLPPLTIPAPTPTPKWVWLSAGTVTLALIGLIVYAALRR